VTISKRTGSQSAKITEFQIQSKFFAWVWERQITRPHYRLIWAVPNSGKRSPWESSKALAEGLRKGVPDVTVAIPRTPYHGLFMEFKSEHGELSKLQQIILTELQAQGYMIAIPRSVEDAQKILLSYLGETR
jgi:hypothetical protein